MPTKTITPRFFRTEFSIACSCCYIYGTKANSRVNEISAFFKKYGYNYSIDEELSSNDGTICFFVSGNNRAELGRSHYIIGIKGTHINSSTTVKDIISDIAIAFSRGNRNSQFENRKNRVREQILKVQSRNPNAKFIGIAAHSLGASIGYYIFTSDEFINNTVESCYCFNMGSSPLDKFIRNDSIPKSVYSRIFIFHIKNDKISENSYLYKGDYTSFTLNETKTKFYLKMLGRFTTFGSKLLYDWTKTGKYHSITNFIV